MKLLPGASGASYAPKQSLRPPTDRRTRSSPSLRRRLVGFALAAALPLLLLASGAVWQQHRAERARAEEGLVARAHAMALLLDREFAAAASLMQALAGSPALARGDLQTFWSEMRASASASGARAVNLMGADGSIRLSTAWMPGERAGTRSTGPAVEALATGRVVTGDLFVSPTVGSWSIAVAVPLTLPDGTRNALGLVLPRERLLSTLTEQRLPPGAVASVLDRRQTIVARTMRDQETVATRPAAEILAAMGQQQAGLIPPYRALEGERVVAAHAVAPQSGFRVKVTIPEATYHAALRQALLPTLLVGAGLLGATIVFGALFAGRLSDSLRRLGDPDYPAVPGGTAVREFDELGAVLARRAEARERAAAEARALFEDSPVGVVRCDAGGRVTEANDAFLRIVGMARADLVAGRVRWDDLTPPEWIGRDEAAIAEAVRDGACAPYQKEYVRPDGTRVPVLIFFAFHDPAHGVASAFVVDLSGWEATEAALAHAHEQMRLAMQAARIFSWDWNVLSGAVQWSSGLEAALGMSEGSFGGTVDAFRALVHPDDLPRVEEALRAALDGTRPYDIEFRMLRPDGSERWLVTRGTVLRDGTGRPTRMIGIDFDITDRKRVEIALTESKVALRRITEAARVATFEMDDPASGKPGTASPGFRALYGLPPDAPCDYATVLGQVHAEDRPAIQAEHRRLAAEGGSYDIEFRVMHPAGLRWIQSMGEGEPGPGDLPRRLRGVALDITARKLAEHALAAREGQLRQALQDIHAVYADAPVGLALIGRDYRFRSINAALAAINGRPVDDHIGRTVAEVVPELWWEIAPQYRTVLERGEALVDVPLSGRVAGGREEGAWLVTYKPVRDEAGAITGVGLTVRPVIPGMQAPSVLAASEARLRQVVEGAPVPMMVQDEDGRILHLSRTWTRISGYRREDIPTIADWARKAYDGQAEQALASVRAAISQEPGRVFEGGSYRVRTSAGEERIWQFQATALAPGLDGRRLLVSTAIDVTEERAAQCALAESEARFRGTFDQAAVGIAHVALDGRWLRVNQRLCEIVGYGREELLGLTFQDITHPDDLAADLGQVQALLAGGIATYSMEKRYRRKDAALVWAELTVSLVRDAAGQPDYFISVVQDIGARKVMQAELTAAEARHADLLETLDLGAFMARDPDGTIRFWSRGCERLYGWTRAEAVGRVSHDLLQTAFPVPLAEINATLERDGQWTGDIRHRTRLGAELVMAAHKALRRGPDGTRVVMEALVDVTAQRRAEEALAQSETRLRLATAGTGIGTWELDLVTGWGQWSEKAAALLGVDVLEATAETWLQVLHPEDRAAAAAAWQRAVAEGVPYEATFRPAAAPGGAACWLVSRGLVERDAAGRPVRGIGVLIDLTSQRRMEAALAESEARLKLFVERAPAAIAMFDIGLRYLAVSQRFLTDYRTAAATDTAALLGRCHYDVFPDVPEAWREVHRQVLAGETLSAEQDALPRADGSTEWVRWEMTPWRRQDGSIGGALLFSEVITARVQAEQALLRSELRLRLATEAADIGVWEWDIATDEVAWDAAMERICGYARPQGPGGTGVFFSHVHPDDRVALNAEISRALDPLGDGQYRGEFRFQRGDGAWRVLLGLGRVMYRSDGQPHAMIGVNLDVTEVKEAQAALARANAELEARVADRTRALVEVAEELRAEMRRREETQAALVQAQKLEALGQLTGSVAHDFNNVLAAVMGSLRLIAKRARDQQQILDLAQSGERAAERAATLIRQLMAFARREELQPVVVSPAKVLGDVEQMLRRAVGSGVTIALQAGPEAWPVLTDPHRLEVALLNLAMNARDAMEGVGSLSVTARNVAGRPDAERPAGLRAERDYVVIATRDSGPGMAPAVLAQAAEPFFTTKPRGQGTGLGLAMVHDFVRQCGGALRLLSPPGEGLTAEIWLPRSMRAAGAVQALGATEPDPALHGAATILVVDDDDQVRLVMATQLRDLGYEVIEADGVEAAMTQVKGLAQLALAITDVTMPGGRGTDLALRLRAVRPGLPILFVSGYGDPDALASEVVIAKPFTPAELSYRVLVALGRLPSSVHERMLMRLSRPELRALYMAWRALREAAGDGLPSPERLDLSAQVGADHAYIVVLDGEEAGEPRLRFVRVGAVLARRLGRPLEGELAGGALEDDDVLGGLGDAYQRCVRLGVPCHDYARFGFGDDGEPLYFERLLLPFAADGAPRPTHLVGMAFFSDPA